ncbi:MAG: hypothetical protein K8J31_21080 [Anaerolineae bacterium]|nr:hypothetical protein [Anaerolineae bacterium]
MPLSRRQFLHMAGAVLLTPSLTPFSLPSQAVLYGRALRAVSVYRQPRESAAVIQHLWPDQIAPIIDLKNGWIRIEDGFIHKADVQPILLDLRDVPTADVQPPFWAEVHAPAASVRQWCAADAPLVTRIGHGGSLQVIDYLPGPPTGWYGVAGAAGALLGWTQAAHWQPARIADHGMPLQLLLDQQVQRITVMHDHQTLLEAPVSTGQRLAVGVYALDRGPVGGLRAQTNSMTYEGLPWALSFGDQSALAGVYWHNAFGEPMPGPAIQVTTDLARWLYACCGMDSQITVLDAR